MLTAQEARNLADRIFGMTTLPECALSLSSTEDVFIRFANNGITTSGYRVEHSVSINATTGDKRSGSAAVSEFSEEALRKGVEKAESLARISQPDPEDMPPLGPQQYPVIRNFDSATAAGRGEILIGHVRAILEAGRPRQLNAPGLAAATAPATARANKAGVS